MVEIPRTIWLSLFPITLSFFPEVAHHARGYILFMGPLHENNVLRNLRARSWFDPTASCSRSTHINMSQSLWKQSNNERYATRLSIRPVCSDNWMRSRRFFLTRNKLGQIRLFAFCIISSTNDYRRIKELWLSCPQLLPLPQHYTAFFQDQEMAYWFLLPQHFSALEIFDYNDIS